MNNKPIIDRITIYPVKSLDGISLQKAEISNGGCLLHDREYAIKDSNGKYVNGKKNAKVHLLRLNIELEKEIVFFRHESETQWRQFSLTDNSEEIDEYLSNFFEMPVRLHKNSEGRFLDVPDKSGMTILSTSSLQNIGEWFGELDLEEMRRRFRATLEIKNVTSFWEDHLFCDDETAIEFLIGDVHVLGMSPRARCVVPTRHPQTGDVIQGFQKHFADQRSVNLPQWSALNNYPHSYFLSVDCLIPSTEVGKLISVGDEVTIIGKKTLPTFIKL